LRLPARGRLLISTDLQGNLGDFNAVARHFLEAGPDAHLVITGDLVHGPDDDTASNWPDFLGTPYRDESIALLEAFVALKARCPGRVHALLGNHDHAHIGGPTTSKFHLDEAKVLESRLDPSQLIWLRETISRFALVATAPCGVVLLHAAPSAAIDGPDDFERIPLGGYDGVPFMDFFRVPLLGPLLWSRMATPTEAERFVRALGGEVAIYGHDVVREGWAKDGPRQLCVSTSFGLLDSDKTYVDVDLAAKYQSVDDLREGVELRRLYS
jgi:Calcineurin-like phosphoesterase